MQKILILTTFSARLRAAVVGREAEGGEIISQNTDVGMVKEYQGEFRYLTVLHALGDGWKLLAPPAMNSAYRVEWEWWLTKD